MSEFLCDPKMSQIQASDIDSCLPSTLPALVFYQRPKARHSSRLLAVGDIGFSGRVEKTALKIGYCELFGDLIPFFKKADLVFGNLEYPLVPTDDYGKMFAGRLPAAQGLKQGGFTIVNLATNHIIEYGISSLESTLDAICSADLIPLGAGDDCAAARKLVVTNINGLRVGWLGCGRTLIPQTELGPRYWEFNEEEILDEVNRCRSSVDLLIISIHIGLMYIDYPRPEHKVMAERLMKQGVDLILMHHAHVLQGVEVTPEGRACCFNLGNFLLDNLEGNVKTPVAVDEQGTGAVFVFDLDEEGIAFASALPICITDDCRVVWADGLFGKRILHRLERISRDLEGDFRTQFEKQRAEHNTPGILKGLIFHTVRGNAKYVFGQLSRFKPEHIRMLWGYLLNKLHKLKFWE
jgi:poly-gamma-glutamate synthesis protein (capsule biosynthesis protein)